MKKRTLLFEEFKRADHFNGLLESVTGDIKDVQSDFDTIKKELEADKEAADDEDIKAALLIQAIEKDGDLESVDVEAVKNEVKEHNKTKGQPINESASGVIHVIEMIGSFAGNMDLIHWICGKIEKLTGKKADADEIAKTIKKIAEALKQISGLPAKALIKFFDWVGAKFGLKTDGAKKAFDIVGRILVLTTLFAFGVMHFPVLGSGVLMWVLSLTGLVGKAVELKHLFHEFTELVKKPEEFSDVTGISQDEIEQMIA